MSPSRPASILYVLIMKFFPFMNVLPLVTLFGGAQGLSNQMCKTYDKSLGLDAHSIVNAANELLPSYDIFSGLLINIVDEEDGEDAGGGTNTEGSYQTTLFNGTEIFPAGICDIPDNGGNPRCGTDSGGTISFLLGPADVLAFYLCSPPPMRYYSYDTIIATRLTEQYPFYPGQPFGDTISNAKINISSSADDEDDDTAFDKPILIIQSADLAAAEAVANAYVATKKVDRAAISIRGIDSGTVRLWDRSGGKSWQDSRPDILSIVSRMTMPYDHPEAASGSESGSSSAQKPLSSFASTRDYEEYKVLQWPAALYRADDEATALLPAKPALLSRGSDVNEVEMLSDVFAELKQSIILSTADGALKGIQTVSLAEEGYYDDWDVVLERRNNDSFAVPTRDAIYGLPVCLSDGACKLESTTSAVVIGVLHRDVLQAAYNSVGVSVLNVRNNQYLETHWITDSDLRGSAKRYLDASASGRGSNAASSMANSDSLFAIDFRPPGKCEGSAYPQWCVEFQEDSLAQLGVVPYLILGERVYAAGETAIGPCVNETIGAELLVFSL